jgi:hypothetical protein
MPMLPLPTFKEAIDLIKKGGTIEAQEKIMELREAYIELQEENLNLRQRLRELEEAISIREKLIWEPPYYFLKIDESKKDGPFCQQCYDKDKKLIRLFRRSDHVWDCKSCKNIYSIR